MKKMYKINQFTEEQFDQFDVTARCYVLGMGISEVLDEIEAKAA